MDTSSPEPSAADHASESPAELSDDLPRCLGRSVLMTGRAVSRVYNDFLRSSGLHATQFQVLVAVRIDRYETLAQLADQLSLERTTLLRNLELLRRQGLVAEAPARRGRAKRYALTLAGETMLAQTLPLWRAAQAAAGFENLGCDLLVCPPATLISRVAQALAGSEVAVGGQDCHFKTSGAHTGDISPEMLTEAGCRFVIVGHSERRQDHAESDALVASKASAADAAGLVAIICVGETLEQREAGRAGAVVAQQLAGSIPEGADAGNTVIAYEPVWAIGTGRNATPDDVAEIHALIRAALVKRFTDGAAFRILYGGSVKPGNARELLAVANVDGALVGGASLKVEDFWGIATSCR